MSIVTHVSLTLHNFSALSVKREIKKNTISE